jgi:hypothetical protein
MVGIAVFVALLAGGTGAAEAGGGRLSPVQERYEPGGVATMVGYTGGPALDGIPDEPYYAYLRPVDDGSRPALDDGGLYVGELALEETAHGGSLHLRVSLTFEVPDDLPAGDYEITYCDDPCTGAFLGDLVPSPLSIGVDPARRVVREWAADDPEIANLAAGALIVGPGFQATASQLRAPAAVPPPPPEPPAPPAPVPDAPAVVTPAPVQEDGTMDWGPATALTLAAGATTGLVLWRRQRVAERAAGATRARGARPLGAGRTPGAAPAGRG